eukprot:scaffold103114_cov63-Phaeocystis_antarctica.AAC.2
MLCGVLFRAVQLIELLVQVGDLFLGRAYPHNQELPSAKVVRCRRPGSQFVALVYRSLHDLGGCQEHAIPLSKVVQVLEIVQHHSLIHAAPLPGHASSHRSLAFHWSSKVQLFLGGFLVSLGLFDLSLPRMVSNSARVLFTQQLVLGS